MGSSCNRQHSDPWNNTFGAQPEARKNYPARKGEWPASKQQAMRDRRLTMWAINCRAVLKLTAKSVQAITEMRVPKDMRN